MSLDDIIRLFECISLILGAVECFARFKIMKATLSIWGLIIGAALGVLIGVSADNTILGFMFVLLFGIGLAVLSFKLYLAGIFILTAFLSTVAIYILFENLFIALLIAAIVGILAIYFVKPVVIVTTSFSGAGIILSSAYIIMDLGVNANPIITAILWIPMALAGIGCQYITTQSSKNERSGIRFSQRLPNPSRTFSERKYPGMQRAYRNFCINCGCELFGITGKCPRCGFSFDD